MSDQAGEDLSERINDLAQHYVGQTSPVNFKDASDQIIKAKKQDQEHLRNTANDGREHVCKLVFGVLGLAGSAAVAITCVVCSGPADRKDVIETILKMLGTGAGGLAGGFALGKNYTKK